MTNKMLFEKDTEMPIERLHDEIDQFDKAQELADEGMEGWDKLVVLATETTIRRVHDSVLPVPSIDELYDDDNYGLCDNCGEMHVLCPICEFCLKYCHDPATCGLPCWPEDD